METVKRIVLEVKDKDHREIKTRASQEGISMKKYILRALAREIYENERKNSVEKDLMHLQ